MTCGSETDWLSWVDSVPSTATNEGSVVLLGKKGETRPQIIPELQNIGVIQYVLCALGFWLHTDRGLDAQTSARRLPQPGFDLERSVCLLCSLRRLRRLTLFSSTGRVYSWGAYSSGALGLGHPDLPNTSLAIPPPLPREEPATAPTSAIPAPGLVQRAQAFLPPMPATPAYLSSLLPGGLLGGPGPAVVPRRHVNPPERVDKPTEIIFDGEEISTANGGYAGAASTPRTGPKRNKFVYSITAGGWHSGCLAVDLNLDEGLPAAAEEEVDMPVIDCYRASSARSSPSREAPSTSTSDNSGTGFGGLNVHASPFRIGFAGRGANRGAGGSGLTRGGGGATYRRPSDNSAS